MSSSFPLLIQKLDAFIHKYYKNELIKGAIYSVALLVMAFLLIAVGEYYAYFSSILRTTIFYFFIAGSAFILSWYIARPLFKLYHLQKGLSYQEAAVIIGEHFSNVKDKLLNTLQMQQASQVSNDELLQASIDQRIQELKPIPFSAVIRLGENIRYLKYAALPLLLLLVIAAFRPAIITESTTRLVKHGQTFEKPAPFSIKIVNKKLEAFQQQDYQLELKLDGDEIPENIFLEIDDKRFQLQKTSTISFLYLFKNLNRSLNFRFWADGYYTKSYTLAVIPNPQVLNFTVDLMYPSYLHKAKETLNNTGDLNIPEGTKVSWHFNTSQAEMLRLIWPDTSYQIAANTNRASFYTRMLQSSAYQIVAANKFTPGKDTMKYQVIVNADNAPSIQAEQQQDSIYRNRFYFKGLAKDDYGFSRLSFNYKKIKSEELATTSEKPAVQKIVAQVLPIRFSSTQESFFHFWDWNTINLEAGEQVEYYFEVWDNDGVNGPKAARTQLFVYKAPSAAEIAAERNKENAATKSDIKDALAQAKQLQKEANELNQKLLEKKAPDWSDKQKIKDLINKQQNLQNKLEEIAKENKTNNERNSEQLQDQQVIKDKQEALQKLMDKVMSDELKKIMEDLQKNLDKLDKSQLQEKIDEMKLDSKNIEKELDRTMELFKQLEFDEKLSESISKIEELAKKQDELSKQSEDKNSEAKKIAAQQEKLNKEFENLKKDLKDLEKKDQEMEDPNGFKNPEATQQEISKQQEESKNELDKNNKSKASKSQKQASDKMQKMAEDLKEQQSEMESDKNAENAEDLRKLLNNLIHLSFNQEKLIKNLKATSLNSPEYLNIGKQQRELKDEAKMIEDSLLALSKRAIEIKPIVNREITLINDNIKKAIENLEARDVAQAASRQQLSMTSINNLALLLNESLQQMTKQQRESKSKSKQSGKNTCQKPGSSGKPQKPKQAMSMKQLRSMQEKLSKQMQESGKQIPQGQKPGKQMSEQFAKMAAQQEAIRRELQKLNKEENKDGKGKLGNLDKLAEQMEQNEKDLVNKNLTQEIQKRQQDIVTRLLEAEKAERERDLDEKRESNEAKSLPKRNPEEFEKYKREKMKEVELLQTVPPAFNSFYKKKTQDYFQQLAK